jgi:hypothetical protein
MLSVPASIPATNVSTFAPAVPADPDTASPAELEEAGLRSGRCALARWHRR